MDIITVLVAIIGSTAIWSFLQFLIKRHDDKDTTLKEIKTSIESLNAKVEGLDEKGKRNEALTARTRILRFADEILDGRKHSRGAYLDAIDSCELYETYFEQHPTEINGHGKEACKIIRNTFDELVKKGEFRIEDDET